MRVMHSCQATCQKEACGAWEIDWRPLPTAGQIGQLDAAISATCGDSSCTTWCLCGVLHSGARSGEARDAGGGGLKLWIWG